MAVKKPTSENSKVMILLVDFFRSEFADDPVGVTYWLRQNDPALDMQDFLDGIDLTKAEYQNE